MYISQTTRQAYSEIDTFLKCLNNNEINKIPISVREFFTREKDKNYIKEIDINVPISEQGLKEETLAIIAMLNLKYWCNNEVEKERLSKVYAENERKYKEAMKEKYASNDMFALKKLNVKEKIFRKNEIVEYSPKTWWEKIKEFFCCIGKSNLYNKKYIMHKPKKQRFRINKSLRDE